MRGSRVERGGLVGHEGGELKVGDELVDRHLLPEEDADGLAVVPRHAHDEGDRREDEPEDALEADDRPCAHGGGVREGGAEGFDARGAGLGSHARRIARGVGLDEGAVDEGAGQARDERLEAEACCQKEGRPSMKLMSAMSAMKARSIAATLKARVRPSLAPRAALLDDVDVELLDLDLGAAAGLGGLGLGDHRSSPDERGRGGHDGRGEEVAGDLAEVGAAEPDVTRP